VNCGMAGVEADAEQSAESTLALPMSVIMPDECTLFTVLTRPMPDYALQHVFSQHGAVDWVCTMTPNLPVQQEITNQLQEVPSAQWTPVLRMRCDDARNTVLIIQKGISCSCKQEHLW
jgi:hypothetical protein